jgi:hypothetical protein
MGFRPLSLKEPRPLRIGGSRSLNDRIVAIVALQTQRLGYHCLHVVHARRTRFAASIFARYLNREPSAYANCLGHSAIAWERTRFCSTCQPDLAFGNAPAADTGNHTGRNTYVIMVAILSREVGPSQKGQSDSRFALLRMCRIGRRAT